ncbi:unnamed protein product [Ectocarpus sp. 12 AP-2014]
MHNIATSTCSCPALCCIYGLIRVPVIERLETNGAVGGFDLIDNLSRNSGRSVLPRGVIWHVHSLCDFRVDVVTQILA